MQVKTKYLYEQYRQRRIHLHPLTIIEWKENAVCDDSFKLFKHIGKRFQS